ncbi:MAG: (d)CMP kinase [Methanosarcinales archaeon]
MIITISGKPGSGKSTLAKALSDYFLMDLVSSGEVFRQLAKEQNKTLLEFGKLCESNPEIDRMIDERQKKIAQERDNIIIEGRLSGHLINADLKIWLKASLEERAKRIAQRENLETEEARDATKKREISEAKRYKDFYGIDINDLEIYDIVINTNKWDKEGVFNILKNAIKEFLRYPKSAIALPNHDRA